MTLETMKNTGSCFRRRLMDIDNVQKINCLFLMNAFVFVVLCFIILFCVTACEEQPPPYETEVKVAGVQPARGDKVVIHLYFADRENAYLTAEDKRVSRPAEATAMGAIIVEALIDGPRNAFMRTIPQGTALKAFYILENGTAYVDLSKEIKENHPGGAQSELMTIYSLVNSIVLNIADVDAVKILIDGHEETTLAGHVDLRFPFKANILLIR